MDTVSFLLKRYKSWTIDVHGLGEITHMRNVESVYNAISAGRFPIPTYKANGKRVADVRAVAAYLDKQRKAADKLHRQEQERLRRAG